MFKSYGLAVCFVAWICMCSGDDVVVQMFSKKPVNYISEKYISYSIDPNELLEMSKNREDNFVYRMMESGPCYIKIYGNNTNKMRLDGEFIDLNSSKLPLAQLKTVYDVLRTAGIKPVIALPYDPNNWNTRNVMRILGKVALLEMNDITWQLGADFHAKDAISYIDDLNTLKLIVGAFSTKANMKNWSVVGSDITVGSNEDEARLYSELSKYIVDAVGWSQSIELSYSDENVDDFFSPLNIDSALRTILNGEPPVWLSLLQKSADSKNPLTHMKQGLNWAQILGDAAKNGFKVIYTPIEKQTWYEPTMSYYTTLLHKRIIGQTVFDTKMFNGNRFDSHFYAHCTKNMSGSFTLFGVNAADSSLDITAKLPFRSGTEYMEFILTVGVNGKVYLNGAEIIEPTVLAPVPKYKLPGKSAHLTMPAHSIAFWVFTSAKVSECASVEPVLFEFKQPQERTSSENLLQQLIVENVANDEHVFNSVESKNAIKRSKRHAMLTENDDVSIHRNNIEKNSEYNAIDVTNIDNESQTRDKRYIGDGKLIYNNIDNLKRRSLFMPNAMKLVLPVKRSKRDISMLKNLFDKFDFKKPTLNFKPTLKLGTKGLIPTISTVHDVLNPSGVEKKLFDQIENPDLPAGDVHFEMAEAVTEPNEYAAALNAANKIVDSPQTLDPYSTVGFPSPVEVSASLTNAVQSPVFVSELTEIDNPEVATAAAPISVAAVPVQMKPTQAQLQPMQPVQHQLQYVIKDLPPTWQVNRDNMEKTRNNLRQNLWPMSNNVQQAVNQKPIAAYLPNVAIQNAQPAQEHVFFESKRRRRRAIDSRMNEEIERRIQQNVLKRELRLDQSIDQIELLDKLFQIVNQMERSQANSVSKNNAVSPLGLLSNDRTIHESENGVPKKCKVLSMAMEQECLQTENRPKELFKRAIDLKRTNVPLKKIFAKIKETVERPLKIRGRRSIHETSENDINTIFKEYPSNGEYTPYKKNVYTKRHNESTRPTPAAVEIPTTSSSPAESTTPTTSSNFKLFTIIRTKEDVPKMLHTMQDYVSNITDTVTRQISRIWKSLL